MLREKTRWISVFLLTPLREGRPNPHIVTSIATEISTHAPAGGATRRICTKRKCCAFLLTPLREGRQNCAGIRRAPKCISTHAPAGGATCCEIFPLRTSFSFLLTPLREGRLKRYAAASDRNRFLLTPLREGRHPVRANLPLHPRFLLTPLREGRHGWRGVYELSGTYFYSRPCGRGDVVRISPT